MFPELDQEVAFASARYWRKMPMICGFHLDFTDRIFAGSLAKPKRSATIFRKAVAYPSTVERLVDTLNTASRKAPTVNWVVTVTLMKDRFGSYGI
jgi:hypothetical protein